MVRVCDAIMGTGKSSAAIDYMNRNKDKHFVYITPYLEEAKRIRDGCPDLHFVEPSNKIPEYHFRKCEHTAALIQQGRNITTTHQAFKMYDHEMLSNIRNGNYQLIIDENIEVLEKYDIHEDDVQMALDAGYISLHNDCYKIEKHDYKGKVLKEFMSCLEVRDLIHIKDGVKEQLFFWILPPNLINAFEDVIIMTYLFKGQGLHHMLEMYNIPYEYVGIEKIGNRDYRFAAYPGYTPEYVSNIKNMIHIVDSPNLNAIGERKYDLSIAWFDKASSDIEQLRKNISNCINNTWRNVPASKKLWATYNSQSKKIAGKGYTKSFLTFNARATNQYKDRECLVYIANIFMNVGEKLFYKNNGIEVDEDAYALSVMIQWIWRSAIRDGNEVNIYIPSKRMRSLLEDWMERVSKEGNNV